ncbi:MAG TPA: exopolysaccharide biosynthesis polyprenyl glycosylphosphotransferase [Ohtaekwangia sp.]|nr:exopolysaccharide biosynthesis polyprenyl glycosylphosphotransferase [Ohtaekwangia sp.]
MRTREFIVLFFIIDMMLLNAAIFLAALYRGADLHLLWEDRLTIVMNLSTALVYIIFIDDMKYLKADLTTVLRSLIQRLTAFISIAALITIWFDIENLSRVQFIGTVCLFSIFKLVLGLFLFKKMSLTNNRGSKIIIVGDNTISHQIFKYCKSNLYHGYEPLGILTEQENTGHHSNIIGTVEDFQRIYDTTPFNVCIISLPLHESENIKHLVHISEKNGVRPRIVPNWYNIIHRNFVVSSLGTIPLLDIRNVPLYHYPNRFWKRAFDIAVSGGLLIALSPVFLVIAILIKLEGRGPVFYTPIRLGVNNTPFKLYKFRSMKVNDNILDGTRSTTINDERITFLGKFLRKSNLDELPQLYNVLMNEMSIVGPRPHRVFLNKTLQEKVSTYMVRHSIKPGITGWAQVNGWRGPTESRLQYMGRTLHDLWYIEHWSFGLDLYIMFLTAFGKKSRKNAF